jgi:transcriptional regulator with XRE-family HTH domain
MSYAIPEMEPFVRELRARIRASGLSGSDIEERAGVSTQYLSQLINGRADLKVFQLFRILTALAVEPTEFFTAVARRYRRVPSAVSQTVLDAITRQVVEQLAEVVRTIVEKPLGDAQTDGEEDDRSGG